MSKNGHSVVIEGDATQGRELIYQILIRAKLGKRTLVEFVLYEANSGSDADALAQEIKERTWVVGSDEYKVARMIRAIHSDSDVIIEVAVRC